MKILLPSNLDVSLAVNGYVPRYYEKYLWIVHCIVKGNQENKNCYQEYVHLNKKKLERFIGSRYTTNIINQLIQSGIIERDTSYQVNVRSMSYRLTETYRNSPINHIEITGSKTLNYERKNKEYRRTQRSFLMKDKTLQQLHYNAREVNIDIAGAGSFINEHYANGTLSLGQLNSYKYTIDTIGTDEMKNDYKRNDKTGRIYHGVANCPRDLRGFLSYNGEPLYQVDISNSQPLLFCPLIDRYISATKIPEFTCTNQIYSNILHSYYLLLPSSISSYISSPYVLTITYPQDVRLYCELTSKGKFYEYLMREIGIPEIERDQFKTKFFERIFYSRLPKKREYRYSQKFKVLFPTVYKAVMWYKKKDHKDLPIELQRVESDVVIKGVCNRLVLENAPNRRPFFVTVHDSVVCLEKDAPYIKQLMEEELTNVLKFTPTLKIKLF